MLRRNSLYAMFLIGIIILETSGIVAATVDGSTGDGLKEGNIIKDESVDRILSTGNTPYLYLQTCCIQKYYFNTFGTDYFLLPIGVEIWNSTLQPVKNAKVNIKIYNKNGDGLHMLYDRTKYTDSSGKVRFGFMQSYANYVVYGATDYRIYVTADYGTKKVQYRTIFDVYWNEESLKKSENAGFETPLYRLWLGSSGDHFYTTSEEERDKAVGYGYVYEGICCYVNINPDFIYNGNSEVFNRSRKKE